MIRQTPLAPYLMRMVRGGRRKASEKTMWKLHAISAVVCSMATSLRQPY